MKGYLRLTRRLLSILCVLVVLNAGAFSACADDKKLPEEDEGVIAVDDLFNREDQAEELTIVVSDAVQRLNLSCRREKINRKKQMIS